MDASVNRPFLGAFPFRWWDWVVLGDCSPRTPTDPSVRSLTHSAPLVFVFDTFVVGVFSWQCGSVALCGAIGSGLIEGACKNLVGRRLKQTGAPWRLSRANRMATICTTNVQNSVKSSRCFRVVYRARSVNQGRSGSIPGLRHGLCELQRRGLCKFPPLVFLPLCGRIPPDLMGV